MTWYTWRRCRGALILILIGVVFLLQESHVLPWSGGWPLILIGIGIILLAERMWPQPPPPPLPPGYQPYPGYPPTYAAPYAGYPGAPAGPPAAPAQTAPPPENPHTEDWK
jgi:Domain of unknown function (DUF5668)